VERELIVKIEEPERNPPLAHKSYMTWDGTRSVAVEVIFSVACDVTAIWQQ
jgi:hypothetical protein